MGLLRYLRGDDLLQDSSNNGSDESRALPRPDNQIPWRGFYLANPNITPSTGLAIGDVWAAVRVLADAASSLPIHVYRRTEQGRERVTSGRLVELLDRPGPGTTQADLVSTLMAHLLLHGAAYLAKYRQRARSRSWACSIPSRSGPSSRTGSCASATTQAAARSRCSLRPTLCTSKASRSMD